MSLPVLDVITYQLELPSTGQKITYRPFLVKEHKILLTILNSEAQEVSRVLYDLIDVCTFKKLNVKDLTHFDLEYLFINLRAKSVGESAAITLTCEKCQTKIDTTMDLSKARVERVDGHTNKIKISDNVYVEFRYPTLDEVIETYESSDAEKVFKFIVKNCKGIYTNENYFNSKDVSFEELEEFFNQLTKAQFDLIEDFFVTMPKVVQDVNANCNNCGHVNNLRVEGLSNFFV